MVNVLTKISIGIFITVPLIGLIFLLYNPQTVKYLISKTEEIQRYIIVKEGQYFNGKLFSSIQFIASWTVPSMYLALMVTLSYIFFSKVLHKIPNPKTTLYIILLATLPISFILSIFTTPEKLTHYNVERYNAEFVHDNLIFFPDQTCRTCLLSKPARSKHCKYCGGCVILYDHHCVWLNNCVGKGNYHWFYSFVLLNVLVLTYGVVIIGRLVWSEWDGFKNFDETIYETMLLFVCSMFDLVILWFAWMNYSMIKQGVTTNEYSKWESIFELIEDRQLLKVSDLYYEFLPSERKFVSANLRDNRVKHIDEEQGNWIKSIEEIDNIYDKGSFRENLKERLR